MHRPQQGVAPAGFFSMSAMAMATVKVAPAYGVLLLEIHERSSVPALVSVSARPLLVHTTAHRWLQQLG